MRFIIPILLILHGLIHLAGFLHETGIFYFDIHATRLAAKLLPPGIPGGLWLLATLLFFTTAYLLIRNHASWMLSGIFAVILSQVMVLAYWPSAAAGSFANLLILSICLIARAEKKFNALTQKKADAMFGISGKLRPVTDLPAPVQKWLQHSGVLKLPAITSVLIRQEGEMLLKPGSTRPLSCRSEQLSSTRTPGFIWKVKMKLLAFLPLTGRDLCLFGKASMQIRILSLFKIVNAKGDRLYRSALQRWLAEICWYPSAALNSFVEWYPIDDTHAGATIQVNDIKCSVDFEFNGQGDVIACEAQRYMKTGKDAPLLKWVVRSFDFDTLDGVRMPVRSEVTWKLPEGDFTWYRFRVTELHYNVKNFK